MDNTTNRQVKVVNKRNSVLHNMGVQVNSNKDMKYHEEGRLIAQGVDVLSTVESYLTGYLGYDLKGINSFYEWRDYPRNTDYEVCELGLVRNKSNGRVLEMSLKDVYAVGSKNVWRLRVTIPNVGTLKVAQIVAETFLGEQPEGTVVGHKNDIPIDNRVDNLEYITPDENKTIDWVLRDVVRKGLNTSQVNVVYTQINEVLEDKYGEDFEVVELQDEDILEVMEHVDIYKRTVNEIYKFVRFGTGVLSRLMEVNGKFYV